jgi:hypothetical protein
MLTFITFALMCLLAGMVLGQRFKVLVLVPAMAASLPVAIGLGISGHGGVGPVMLLAALAMASLQIGYLAGVGIRHALAAARISELQSASLRGSAPVRHTSP